MSSVRGVPATDSSGQGLDGVEIHEPRRQQPTGLVHQFLTFLLGGERYGMSISCIVEILKYRKATPVPRADPVVHGIVSLRGRIITVVDGRLRLGLGAEAAGEASRIVVVRDGRDQVGILVDEVLEVVKLPEAAVRPAPPTVSRTAEKGISGICNAGDGSLLILLDLDSFLRF